MMTATARKTPSSSRWPEQPYLGADGQVGKFTLGDYLAYLRVVVVGGLYGAARGLYGDAPRRQSA